MKDLISKSKNYIFDTLNITSIKEYILISIEHQELYIIDDMKVISSYKISTSKYGTGNINDSETFSDTIKTYLRSFIK